MPHDAAVSSGNGVVGIEVRRGKALPPGPGMFVSDGKEWRAQMTPVTTQQRDPINPERWIDVPVTDPKTGAVLMQVNPAAADTIGRTAGDGAKGIPVAQPPEPKDAVKEQMNTLIEMQRASIEAAAKRDERMDRLVELLATSLAGKKPRKVKAKVEGV